MFFALATVCWLIVAVISAVEGDVNLAAVACTVIFVASTMANALRWRRGR